MDKITYLAELAEGLARWVPERERQDILRWYAEYFEEAGPEREAGVVAELGDPWALSCRLAVEGGYVTHEKAASWRPKKAWPRVLLGTAVGLLIFALVAGTGLLGALAFNVVRTVSGPYEFGEVEQVAVVDWGVEPVWGYNAVFDDPSAMGPYYCMDAESINAFCSIDIDISLGNIEVVAGDGYTVSIRRGEALLGYEPVLEVRDGVLRLRDSELLWQVQVDGWEDFKNLFGVDRTALDMTITVPENALLNSVSIKTGLGDVLLWGLDVEAVAVETGLGDVACYETWNTQRLELETGVGDVNLGMSEVRPGADIRLESGTGNVEIDLGCFESDCRYELESGLGFVTINGVVQGSGAERKGSAVCSLDAESGTGSVSVNFIR